jgi:putative peptidoglycan lipid II flippase
MLVKILAPAFYSRQDTRTPVRIAIWSMLANMALNLLFVLPMVLLEVPGAHAGLALATSLASYLNAGLLYRHLRIDKVYQPGAGWLKLMLKMLAAVAAMGVIVLWGIPDATAFSTMSGHEKALTTSLWIGAGAVTYLLALRFTGLRLAMLWAPAETAGRP